LGPVALGHKDEMFFLGRELGEQRNYSDRVAEAIDEEVRRLIDTNWQRAQEIIIQHRDKLDRLADELVREETLEGERLMRIFRDDDQAEGGVPASDLPPAPQPEPEKPAERPAPAPRPRLVPGPATGV